MAGVVQEGKSSVSPNKKYLDGQQDVPGKQKVEPLLKVQTLMFPKNVNRLLHPFKMMIRKDLLIFILTKYLVFHSK